MILASKERRILSTPQVVSVSPWGKLGTLGQATSLAGDDGRGDAAGRAGQRLVDPPRHLGAQAQQPFAPAATRRLARRRDAVGRAIAVADPADAGEIEFP